jgi:hypothetical protein
MKTNSPVTISHILAAACSLIAASPLKHVLTIRLWRAPLSRNSPHIQQTRLPGFLFWP